MYTRSLEMDTHFLALEMHAGCLHAYIYDVYVFFTYIYKALEAYAWLTL